MTLVTKFYNNHTNLIPKRSTIMNIREAIDSLRANKTHFKPVAIALDTKGPEIRTGLLQGGGSAIVNLEKGEKIILSLDDSDKECGNKDKIWVDYKNLPKVIQVGDLVFIDDGLISLKVILHLSTIFTSV